MAATRITTIQATLNNRLSVAATVGDTALATAVTAIQNATPEVAVVILADTGADPLKYPYLVSTTYLLCVVLSHLLHPFQVSSSHGRPLLQLRWQAFCATAQRRFIAFGWVVDTDTICCRVRGNVHAGWQQ